MHVPHYCHMFESVMAGPRPWRFGHVYLPGGSANLGNPCALVRPSTAFSLSQGSRSHVPRVQLLGKWSGLSLGFATKECQGRGYGLEHWLWPLRGWQDCV